MNNVKNIAGQKFGELTAIRQSIGRRDSKGAILWECLCSCGKTVFQSGSKLRLGRVKTCGRHNDNKTVGEKIRALRLYTTGNMFTPSQIAYRIKMPDNKNGICAELRAMLQRGDVEIVPTPGLRGRNREAVFYRRVIDRDRAPLLLVSRPKKRGHNKWAR